MNKHDDKQLVPVQNDKKTAVARVVGFTSQHADKIAIVGVCALAATPAFASIDVSGTVDSIGDLKDPINKIGAALLGIAVVILGWRLVRSVIR